MQQSTAVAQPGSSSSSMGTELVLPNLLRTLGFEPADAARPTSLAAGRWGFAEGLPGVPSLAALQAAALQGDLQSSSTDAGSYIARLQAARSFRSPHCVDAMVEHLGLDKLARGLSGSLLGATLEQFAGLPPAPAPSPAAAAAAAVRARALRTIDTAWSREAVRRGVGYAKAGDYEQAMGCYSKALQLAPSNADALVARGAAHANQGRYDAAVDDFEAALLLQPSNLNAARYLDATRLHAAAQSAAQGTGDSVPPAPADVGTGAVGRARGHVPSLALAQTHTTRQPAAAVQQQEQRQRNRSGSRSVGVGVSNSDRHRANHSRSRSRSTDSSGSSRSGRRSSSGSGQSRSPPCSDADGNSSKARRGATAVDVLEAIQELRSAGKISRGKQHRRRHGGGKHSRNKAKSLKKKKKRRKG